MRAILLASATVTRIFRLGSQHLCQPGSLGSSTPAGLLNHGTCPDDQQASDGLFAAFRDGPESLLPAAKP